MKDKTFDKTHLDIDAAEDRLVFHRDYIAHCLRWTYILRWLERDKRYYTASVFDIGAGKDLPLYKLLCTNRMNRVKYAAVDVNKLELPHNFAKRSLKCTLHSKTDFLSLPFEAFDGVDTFTCFEVLEHVPAYYAIDILKRVRLLMDCNSHFILSTPCYDEKKGAAANHINEMTRDTVGYLLEQVGFEIVENYGTFASQKDYKEYLTDSELDLLNKLSKYHYTHYLATIFAPIYPQYSRNNIWNVKVADKDYVKKFNKPTAPYGQCNSWKDLINK